MDSDDSGGLHTQAETTGETEGHTSTENWQWSWHLNTIADINLRGVGTRCIWESVVEGESTIGHEHCSSRKTCDKRGEVGRAILGNLNLHSAVGALGHQKVNPAEDTHRNTVRESESGVGGKLV